MYSSLAPFALDWRVVFEEETWNTEPIRIAGGHLVGEGLRYADADNVNLSVMTGNKPRICLNSIAVGTPGEWVFGDATVFGEQL